MILRHPCLLFPLLHQHPHILFLLHHLPFPWILLQYHWMRPLTQWCLAIFLVWMTWYSIASIITDLRDVDLREVRTVTQFQVETCGCRLYNGGPCSCAFSKEKLLDIRSQCLGLDHQGLDFVLMGQIMAGTSTSNQAISTGSTTHQRQQLHTKFHYKSLRVKKS